MNQKSAMIKTKWQKNNNDDNRSEHQEFIKQVNRPIYAINYIVLSHQFCLKLTHIRKKINDSDPNNLSIKITNFQI